MTPILITSDFIALILRPNATLDTAQAFYLSQPTQVSYLIIKLEGRKQDLEGNFGLLVAYFNKAGDLLLFHFSARLHDTNEVEIVNQVVRPDFLCTHIKFLGGAQLDDEPLIFNVKVHKF